MDTCLSCGHPCARITDEFFRCVHCNLGRSIYNYDPNVYEEKYAKNYLAYAEGELNTPLNLFRLGLVSRWMRIGDKLLDIGCCVGEFIKFAKQYYDCFGFEPNPHALKHAKKRVTGSLITNSFEILKGYGKFDVITMFDVIEHIGRPVEFIETLRKDFLNKDGILVFTTPDLNSLNPLSENSLLAWKHYKPREHLFLHSELSLITMLEMCRFSVIHVGNEESDIRPGNPNSDLLTVVARRNREQGS